MAAMQFARTADGVKIGFFQLGEGRPVVFASNAFGDAHLYNSLHPHTRRMTDRLAEYGWSVIRYDVRGTGASDREVPVMDLDAFVQDLDAVVDELGLKHFALAGLHGGAATATAFAARRPECVSHLILLNPFRTGAYPFEVDPVGRAIASVSSIATDDFAFFSLVAGNLMTRFSNPEHAKQLAEVFQRSTTPATQVAYIEALRQIDLSGDFPRLKMPVLVVHDTGFPFGSFEERETVAASIPLSRLTVVPADGEAEIAEIDAFLRFSPPAALSRGESGSARLSRREQEVIALVAKGRSNREIAAELVLSERTVARHLSNIYTRLDLHTRAEATAYAIQRGLA